MQFAGADMEGVMGSKDPRPKSYWGNQKNGVVHYCIVFSGYKNDVCGLSVGHMMIGILQEKH